MVTESVDSHAFGDPERILPDKFRVPDISFLTKCNLPGQIDLRETGPVIKLLGEFVAEEKARNPRYKGMFILGSIAHNSSKNGSDIDGLHVVDAPRYRSYSYTESIRFRLESILTLCYGIPVQDGRFVVNLQDDLFPIQNATAELDKFSIPVGISRRNLAVIQNISQYQYREPYTGKRPFKKGSIETLPHIYSFPANGIFPWYTEMGLLQKSL